MIDNLINGHETALERVRDITKCELQFKNIDIRDTNALDKIFKSFKPDAVIHFAGLKAFEIMSWQPERNIKNICEDTWRWHTLNPIGYGIE